MYDFIELFSAGLRERSERFERDIARRRASRAHTSRAHTGRARTGTLHSNSATDPDWGSTDVGPATEPLTVIPQPVPASHHIAAQRTGLGRLAY